MNGDAVIRVYDEAGNVIETHQHKGEFKGVVSYYVGLPPIKLCRAISHTRHQ